MLFIFFAYKNHGAIQDTSKQRMVVIEQIKSSPIVGDGLSAEQIKVASDRRQALETTLVQPDLGGIRTFHYTCDVLTVGALWAMERRRRLMAEEAKVTKVV